MKKTLFLILMTLMVVSGFSQTSDWTQKRWANTFAMDTEDTTYVVLPSVSYVWNIFVKVTSNTDTVRLVLLQGPNGTDWCGYYNTDTVYITNSADNKSFEEVIGVVAKYVGMEVTATDEATVDIWYTTRRK